MSMQLYLLVIVLTSIGVCYFCFLSLRKRKLKERRPRKISELHQEFEQLEGQIDLNLFSNSVEKLSDLFSIPAEKLRLQDTVGKDIGCAFPLSMFDSIATEDFYEYVSEQAKEAGIVYEGHIVTAKDFIKFENCVRKSREVKS